ncbi:MAG: hydroxysqualene dehydroxylase HpnE [Gemmatimonadota bacterium]
MSRHVCVVGAGWSGLACALALQQHGSDVTLIDAAPRPGGRARRVDVALGDASYPLDNGQHLLVGAYRETLKVIARVGLDPARMLLRVPFGLRYPDGFALAARRLPAPWHLATALLAAGRFTFADRISLARDVHQWKRDGWLLARDVPAREVLRFATPGALRRVWNPLCLAALNAPLDQASGQILLNVLKDSIGTGAAASDMLVPRCDLSALFPDAALRALRDGGARVILRAAATALITRPGARWSLALRDRTLDADAVVLALPPERAAALLESSALAELSPAVAQLRRIESAPIATVYLRYVPPLRLAAPLYALHDDPGRGRFGQWVFDRGVLDPARAGVLAVVISGSGPHLGVERDGLCKAVADQLSEDLALPPPLAHRVIVEKRATILPRPGLLRPAVSLPAPGLFLAGDAADSGYPSTIEGSVRAGIAAAHAAISA